jgi:hypothetical protein
MKKIITFIFMLFVAMSISAQKIVSHTTLLSKVYDSHIDQTDFTDGHTTFTLFLSVTENKIVKAVQLVYTSKEKLVSVLKFLYDFKKGEGYNIDLESTNGGASITFGRGFYIYTNTDLDKVPVSRYVLGKLLNGLGVPVKTGEAPETKSDDDMYSSTPQRY